ncbi:hypothetical protein HanPSC8_Chr10g0416351 [Helianthus annuus]|nr:hypothetical protein HanPSC8_Chr10g0416351 [Helianthus annuus]
MVFAKDTEQVHVLAATNRAYDLHEVATRTHPIGKLCSNFYMSRLTPDLQDALNRDFKGYPSKIGFVADVDLDAIANTPDGYPVYLIKQSFLVHFRYV